MAPLARRLGLRDVSDELESIARDRLALLPGDTGATYQALAIGALVLPSAARSRYLDEWLGELDVLPSRLDPVDHAGRLDDRGDRPDECR